MFNPFRVNLVSNELWSRCIALLTPREQSFIQQLLCGLENEELGLVKDVTNKCPVRHPRVTFRVKKEAEPRWARGPYPQIVTQVNQPVSEDELSFKTVCLECIYENTLVVITLALTNNSSRWWEPEPHDTYVWVLDRKEKTVKNYSRRSHHSLAKTLLLNNL